MRQGRQSARRMSSANSNCSSTRPLGTMSESAKPSPPVVMRCLSREAAQYGVVLERHQCAVARSSQRNECIVRTKQQRPAQIPRRERKGVESVVKFWRQCRGEV